MTKYFLDTNILLNLPKELNLKNCSICSKTIEELENIKISRHKDEKIKYQARKATKLLLKEDFNICLATKFTSNLLDGYQLPETNDNIILAVAAEEYQEDPSTIFLTRDYLCYLMARDVFEIPAEFITDNQKVYKGYKKITGTSKEINDYFENFNKDEWNINEYLIINESGEYHEMRYDGEKFVPLILPPSSYIKGKNSLQRCTLDMLLNKDITTVVIMGTYGSGKSFLAMNMAMYQTVEKRAFSEILGVREAMGSGKEVGFLKGTFEDKTKMFFLPLVQQLGQKSYDYLSMSGMLSTNIPFYMKGTTYNDTIMVVDEAEDLTEKQIKLIGTRLGENSKIFFSGDHEQSEINDNIDNPLIKLCHELKGDPKFACIVLDDDVRSSTSKMFANIFKD